MKTTRAALASLFTISETIRFLTVVGLSCALTVGIAYGLTRYVTRHAAADPRERQESLEEGSRMRALSNELIGLATEYLNQAEPALLEGPNSFEIWKSTSFLPRLEDYRRRVIAAVDAAPEASPLLSAADALSAQANRAPSPAGREAVAIAVLDATTMVELAIGELGVGRHLSDPPRALSVLEAP